MRARLSCFLAALAAASLAGAQVSVLTRSYDNSRVGANLAETTLSPANVRPNTFGKLFERVVDGQVYGQPLYVPNLTIPSKGTHNVIFCGTMNDSVYAFDADDPSASQPLWKTSFLSTGVTPVPYTDVATQKDVHPVVGIVSTPVIKLANGGGTIYVTAKTKEIVNGVATYAYRLHALDILTGAERAGSPVLISPSVPSTASDSKNGVLKFDPKKHMQRPGLLLLNNVVYAAFASHTDRAPYHGWIVGYNADTLQQAAVFCTTANTGYGGIWQSGQGLSADAQGSIYGITGNAQYDPTISSYGDTFLKLSTASGLSLVDSFTPFNEVDLNAADDDLGCTGAINVPGTNLMVGGGKEGKIYLIDRDNMGGKHSGDDSQIVQSWLATKGHIHGSPVFWSGPTGQLMYVWSEYDKLKAFRFSSGLFNTTPAYQSAVTAPNGMAGGHLTVSANGTSSGIVWASLPLVGDANHDTVPGVVRAFDASNLTEIWNSRLVPERDDVGYHAKFNPPMVANGKMYVAAFGADDGSTPHKIVCYGLLPPPSAPPAAPRGLAAQAGDGQVSLSWSRSLTATSYKIFRTSTFGGTPALLKGGITTTSALDAAATNGTTYYYTVVATNSAGDSGPSNQAAATPGSTSALYRVNSGSGAFSPFAADNYFTGGKARVMGTAVDTNGVLNPAPMDVYRSERYGACTYTFGSLTPGATYLVRLHFAELYWTSPGQRLVDVSINGSPVLTAFDIIGATGGAYRAAVREFPAQANGSGQIAVAFNANPNSPDVSPKVSGVELLGSNGVPGAPTLLASGSNGSVGLFWNLIPGATGYNVYRGTTSLNEDPTPIASNAPGPSFTDGAAANGTTYYYVVRAVGPGGTSARSNEASATPSSTAGFSVATASQITIAAGSSGNTNVTVTAFNGFNGVVALSASGLPAGCSASFAPPSVTGSGGSTLTLTVGGAVPSGTYNLNVIGSSSGSSNSAPLNLVVPAGALPPPTGVEAAAGNTQAFLTWNPVSGADSYNVRRSTNSKGPFDTVGTATGTSATDGGLTNGVRYYYAITALNTSGESGLSTVVTAMPRSQLTVVPSADAYVQAGTSQNTNFGTALTLLAKRASNSSTNGLNRCIYLRLDLTGVTTDPSSAQLVLPIDASSGPDGSTSAIKAYFLGNPTWTESGITWANAPGLDRTTFASTGSMVASATVTLSGSTATFDLTSFVAANKGHIVTLQLMNLNLDGTLTAFSSREASIQPQLRIKWAAP